MILILMIQIPAAYWKVFINRMLIKVKKM